MACIVWGRRTWKGSMSDEGHRTYTIKWLILGTRYDGPANAMRAAGLPQVGSLWFFDDDVDQWAWCRFTKDAQIHQEREGDPNRWWTVEQTFSSKPPDNKSQNQPDENGCQKESVENPLLEPQKISGSFVKYTEEATDAEEVTIYNWFGDEVRTGTKVLNSAWEQLRGPQVEFDADRPQIVIEQNVPSLELGLLAYMSNSVNDAPLWGLPKRTIKFTAGPWSRKNWGTCNLYYTRQLTFEVYVKVDQWGELGSGWDRDIMDEGTKALHGKNKKGEWLVTPVSKFLGVPIMPDPENPNHFVRYKDAHGENARVILDGYGVPVDATPGTGSGTGLSEPGVIRVKKYKETNFLALGIPLTF